MSGAPGAEGATGGDAGKQTPPPGTGGDGGAGPESTPPAKGAEGNGSGGLDFSDPNATKAEIERLRAENAKHRTKNKDLESSVGGLTERLGKFEDGLKKLAGVEDNDLTPEQQIEVMQAQNEQLAIESALKDAAFEYGVGAEGYEYFEFLVGKKLSTLAEGEELTEEDLETIAQQANAKGASANTSVDGEGGDNPPPPAGGEGEVTLDEFSTMGIVARSKMFGDNPALYKKLKAQEEAAKRKT